jgi:hypothetical protein
MPDALDAARANALADTGTLARLVLGYDYDKDARTGECIRPGGILDTGPHQRMVEFLDSPSLNKHLEAPRGSYKTSLLQAYVIRRVLLNRNLRLLYVMETCQLAEEKIKEIRDHFEPGTRLSELFGDLRTAEWSVADGFTIRGRTLSGLSGKSFKPAGVDKGVTGGHYDIIVLDDVVTWNNVNTAEGLDKTRAFFRMVQPLLDPGGTLVVVGTRYDEEDLYAHIIDNLSDQFDILIFDAGVEIITESGKKPRLEGTPTFKHLTLDFLSAKLALKASTRDFSSQYLNRCISSDVAFFTRDMFRCTAWDDWMSSMPCYVITDTATTAQDQGCFSVAGVVGLDAVDNAYLLDLRIGHWLPEEVVGQIADVVEAWQSKVLLRGVLFENITLNRVFRSSLDVESRRRQLKINVIPTPRGGGEPSKDQRIQRVHHRFEQRRFFVVVSGPPSYPFVKKHYQDLGETKVLFDPIGYMMPATGNHLPDGELVKQFIRFPAGKKDIPDAIADIDACDADGNRICSSMNRVVHLQERDRKIRRGMIVPILSRNGDRVQVIDAERVRLPNLDYYSRLAARIRK